MSNPAVTVLMTVYNGSRYLRSSLEAVLEQTFRDFEFLIIDDCSSDDSVAVVRSYPDPRIRLICNEKNLGQTASLNKGLRFAHAPWVARMDADDLAFPTWLARQYEFAQRHPEHAAVSAQAVVIDQDNRIKKTLEAGVSPEAVMVKALTASPVNHVGSLMRKDTVLAAGGYDERYKIAADYDLWCRLLAQGEKLISTPDTLVAIRFHLSSISIRESKSVMYFELVEVIRRNFERLSGHPIDAVEANLVASLFYDLAALSDAEFISARKILAEGYQGLSSKAGLKAEALSAAVELALRKLDVKRIFLCIEAGTVEPVRQIAREQIGAKGALNLFSLLWLLSFLGPGGLRTVPAVYERTVQKRARQRAAGDTNRLKLG